MPDQPDQGQDQGPGTPPPAAGGSADDLDLDAIMKQMEEQADPELAKRDAEEDDPDYGTVKPKGVG
jgi:hypothetical protein